MRDAQDLNEQLPKTMLRSICLWVGTLSCCSVFTCSAPLHWVHVYVLAKQPWSLADSNLCCWISIMPSSHTWICICNCSIYQDWSVTSKTPAIMRHCSVASTSSWTNYTLQQLCCSQRSDFWNQSCVYTLWALLRFPWYVTAMSIFFAEPYGTRNKSHIVCHASCSHASCCLLQVCCT